MNKKELWINRKFTFDFPPEVYPQIIDRLKLTPGKIKGLISGLSKETLTRQDNEKWSIQENIGHLTNVEALFNGRFDDFEAGLDVLRPADMTNKRTFEAGHNNREINDVMEEFTQVRAAVVNRLEEFEPELFSRTARHPRLNQPMRLVDSVFFQAEHDDHHIQHIKELIDLFT